MPKPLYFVVALCTAILLFLAPSPSRADSVSGETTVVLNSSTVTSLSGMGLSLSPLGATAFNSSTLTLFIPMSTGTIGPSGDLFHMDGNGFALASGSNEITFRNLTLNTATDNVIANVHFGSTQLNGVTLFDISSGGVLTLDAQAAANLSSAFGISNLTGTNVGTATVLIPLLGGLGEGTTGSAVSSEGTTIGSDSPTSAPEPSARGLLAASALAIGALALFRRNRARTVIHNT